MNFRFPSRRLAVAKQNDRSGRVFAIESGATEAQSQDH